MSYCTNCGTKLRVKSKFCYNCGNKQDKIKISNNAEEISNSKSNLLLNTSVNPNEEVNEYGGLYFNRNSILKYAFFVAFGVNILIPIIVISIPTLLLTYTGNDNMSDDYEISNQYRYNYGLWSLVFFGLILDIYLLFKFVGEKLVLTSITLSFVYITTLYINPVNFIGFSNHFNDESLFYSLSLMIINGIVLFRFINCRLNIF